MLVFLFPLMSGVLVGLAAKRSRGGAATFIAVTGITMVLVPLALVSAGDTLYGLSLIANAYINTLAMHWEKALIFAAAFTSVLLVPRSARRRDRRRGTGSTIVIRLE